MYVRTLAVAFGSTLAALTLAGCGSSGEPVTTANDTTPASSSPSAAPLPACADVWVKGADLPRGYQGCTRDGKDVPAEVLECESGQRVVTYAGKFWALRGHAVSVAPRGLDKSKVFQRAMASCRG